MATSYILTVENFDSLLDTSAGRQITHVPTVQTTSNISGQETLTRGAGVSIKAYFMRTSQNWDFQKAGFFQKGDAVAVCKIADGVKAEDLLYTDGLSFTITAIDGTATTITVDTSAVHGLSAGDEVIIKNTTNYDGVYTVATITDTDTFTIADTSHDVAAETSGNIVRNFEKFRIKQAFDVPGVFDSTGIGTTMVYTSCNLFLYE